jgi:uncharacterized membrane protein
MSTVISGVKQASRLGSVDMLRGAVMIVMALDHVRDFFHRAAISFSPTDLGKTTPILFLTRWITHFCLPVFMFCAGIGMFLWLQRGRTRAQLSRFLFTRGLWFILLELVVMQFAYDFNVSGKYLILLLILWIFGLCMVAMAALIHLPFPLLAVLSIAIIALHNLLDGINASAFTPAWMWNLLHQPGIISFAGRQALTPYTLLPWVGVMAAGFCFGRTYRLDAKTRRGLMFKIGGGATAAFLLLRFVNHYGDPAPWSQQRSLVFTILSFLNCTKYPGSLDFVLMTLGPAILLLAWFDGRSLSARNPVIIFGRVPMFYFILHFYLIHALLVLMSYIRYGRGASGFIFNPPPAMAGPAQLFPAGFGYGLGMVYIIWIGLVAVLYPLCIWFAGVKARRRDWWLSYL